jgi:dihydroorotate dehydrogenase
MGANNQGALALRQRLHALKRPSIPIGISLGKSSRTPLENAVYDYCASLRLLYQYGDYFAVNVSSPNTPGLRGLQERRQLETLVAALANEAQRLAVLHNEATPKPLLLKLAPDVSESAMIDVLQVCEDYHMCGIIATNTTVGRDGIREALDEAGGLSGRPLTQLALRVVRFLHTETGGRIPIIGAGGIFGPDDAQRMLDAGASLLQVYTGLIYRGPHLVRHINRALAGLTEV